MKIKVAKGRPITGIPNATVTPTVAGPTVVMTIAHICEHGLADQFATIRGSADEARTLAAALLVAAAEADKLATLRDLAQASARFASDPLALHDAYKAAPPGHVEALQRRGYWFVASASQGNLTEAGARALGVE